MSQEEYHAIKTEGLTKQYSSETAVDDLSLSITPGEIYGFLGPNGAGKSTTINLLMDFTRPTSGTINILGEDPRNDVVSVHQRVGVLPDDFSLYESRTGREHLRLFIDTKGANDEPEDLLERVGLEDSIDDKAGDYSRGMSQRLALAMALVGEPDVLILDEPFSGLDPHGVRKVRKVVHEENDRGATVFFSSHVLGQVKLVCDQIGILNEGCLVAEGTLEELQASASINTELKLTVDGDPKRAAQAIDTLEGVIDVSAPEDQIDEQTESERQNHVNKTVTAQIISDEYRRDVIDTIEEVGISVEDTRIKDPSIESIFVAHTSEAPAEVNSND
ncbi:ABC-type multidrug transport system, ATPase component [Natrialba chahannaoensis JCM 10990]|uniref:ABC-type multidrug transport system, ATPase component n=1 Tax=Natrialba chahannaoensis JCM 10990 TaxID=1227492 RepID=M0A5N4_9EURY|nr:ABC transporter ATP-binding protein [Natrialba chahannaoensis]ELY94030.1 ABC-type multidrug transport system, ATPase component [Natrialba chahannaoensis JCM 10990]